MNNDRWFYLDKKHQTLGGISHQELLELHQRKIITNRSYVWKEGFDDWKRFKDVRSSILPNKLNIVPKHTQTETTFKDDKLKEDEIEYSLITIPETLTHINYEAPYTVIWVSENHKKNVTKLSQQIAQNLALQKKLESLRLSPNKPDGLIIGTGEADFTKDNVPYEFTYQNKTFQLIDVPGIEGNEGKYEHYVKQAVEKSHLVIYVNGSNKKPEEVTARKIKKYLNQYAKVYAVCNLRGKADQYDSELEELISLQDSHKEMTDVFNQTLSVLNQTVGSDLIEGGTCVQGLLAFSALAYDQNKNETTISSSRKDLIKTQKSFLRDFASLEKMKSFSQIDVLEEKIISKFSTFEEDIIESNKNKIVRKIEEVIDVIQEQLNKHLELQTKIKKELDVGRDAISRELSNFENNLFNKSNNAVSSSFSNIADDGCRVIEEHFGNQDIISSNIQHIVNHESENLYEKLEIIKEDTNKLYSDNLRDVVKGVGRSIEQVQTNFDLKHSQDLKFSIQLSNMSMFDTSSIGKGLLDIGGMAALGVSIGTVFPVIGNIVGGLLGGVLGLIKFVVSIFSSKESQINKAKSQFINNVNTAQSDFKSQIRSSVSQMVSFVRQDTEKRIIEKMYSEYEKMRDIEHILNAQIQKLSNLSNQIKGKGYGTI